jgi:CBS-domain-containing membrane protein
MQAKDIMARDVITVSEASAVKDVASVLLDRGISAVPVVDASGRMVGIVSEGDLLHRSESGTKRRRSWWLSLFSDADALASEFVKEHSRRVSDVMSRNVISAGPDTELVEIAEILEKHRIKRVPIVENGQLVGIVSRANLVRALTMAPKQGKELEGTDSKIRDRILARLKAEPWSPSWLNVRVENGVVELWGTAASEAQKKAAHIAAELTPGVKSVDDNIVVQRPTYE